MKSDDLIVIGGGVGPMAGVKTDQDHPQWHFSKC
jgi:hypothetical protein